MMKLCSLKQRSQLPSWHCVVIFSPTDSGAAASDSLVYTAAVPVSGGLKTHCASRTTAERIPETRSVNPTQHRLSATIILLNKRHTICERNKTTQSAAYPTVYIARALPLAATACLPRNADLW